jgi:hypothetical protein
MNGKQTNLTGKIKTTYVAVHLRNVATKKKSDTQIC